MTATMLGGALGLLAVSCSGGSDKTADKPRRTTTTAAPTTTTLNPTEAAKQAVIKARQSADQAELNAFGPAHANPDLPAIDGTHTGLMLKRIIDTARGLQIEGIVQRLPAHSKHKLTVKSVRFAKVKGQDVAFLDVCLVEDAERVNPKTGKAFQTGVATFESSEAMQKVAGLWKLAERRQDKAAEGVAGCAIG